jgi:hypothetical protein
MAELIPMEYRITAAKKVAIRRWGFIAGLAALVAASGLTYAANWKRQQLAAFQAVDKAYAESAAVKVSARQLISKREATAKRMQKIQGVQDDQMMLALIRTISSQFSDNDMVQNIALEVHGRAGDERLPLGSFSGRVDGMTRSDDTLAALLDRLSKAGSSGTPAMAVKPGSSSTVDLLDGKAVRFQVTFEMPVKRIADASAQGGS